MYARTNIARWHPETFDHAMELTRDVIIPSYAAADGFKGYMLLTKPGEDVAMAVTLWETEADMQESEKIAQAMIPELRGVLAEPPQTERYEVTIFEQP
jgi:heme-degrading monooxygenase HmoA